MICFREKKFELPGRPLGSQVGVDRVGVDDIDDLHPIATDERLIE